MEYLLPFLFFAAIFINLIYVLFVFAKLISHKNHESINIGITSSPGITIVIAAFNELENLKELLPLLAQQDYPNFEILVADDRSSDGTYDYLLTNADKIKNLTFVHISDLPQHFTAKKFALTMAIKKAKNEILLFTDADCRPSSDLWLKEMVSQLDSGKDLVLGFSPYHFEKGNLNSLIRYETFQTAIQYMSFAISKMPYMGVGRNLMYKKSLFWKNNGFASHHSLLSGDDDLFVNEVANKTNVAICTNPEAYMPSIPKKTWTEWFLQKKRHMSVGKKYKFSSRFNLGLLWMSQLFSWLLFIPILFIFPSWYAAPEWSRIPLDFQKHYHIPKLLFLNDWVRIMLLLFVFWIIIKWIVLAMINNRMGKTIKNAKIPGYEFLYTLYLLIIGVITLFSNPLKIKWK